MTEPDQERSWLRRAPRAHGRPTSSGIVISAGRGRDVVAVGTPGDVVWDMLTTPCYLDELIDALGDTHPDVPRDVISTDVERVVHELSRAEVIEVSPSGP